MLCIESELNPFFSIDILEIKKPNFYNLFCLLECFHSIDACEAMAAWLLCAFKTRARSFNFNIILPAIFDEIPLKYAADLEGIVHKRRVDLKIPRPEADTRVQGHR